MLLASVLTEVSGGFQLLCASQYPVRSVALSLFKCEVVTGSFPKVAMNWFVCMSVKGLVLRQEPGGLKVRGRRHSNN